MTEKVSVGSLSDPLSITDRLPSGNNIELEKAFNLNKSSATSSKIKSESLTIRVTDEARIVSAFRDAAKKLTSGSIFNVKVDIGVTGALGIGVKDLSDNILAVSMLKRSGGVPGAGESAGIRLGDIVFGINFVPTREGSRTLLSTLKRENAKKKRYLHLQLWRCHQLCSDPVPGTLFPIIDEMLVHSYSLYRTKIFIDWERWNFVEILLSYMMEEIKASSATKSDTIKKIEDVSPRDISLTESNLQNHRQINITDLERNILQAKGLRTALCVRIVHTKSQADAVLYVLRVEDVETGLQWVVHRRYRDFHSLHEELSDMNTLVKDIAFPKKTLSLRSSAVLIETRVVALEQYIRRVLHLLTLYATMDPQASRSLRHVQNFLGVDKYIDCVHPPLVDDQRFIELLAYRFLNDFNSPACQQCVRFVTTVDLDDIMIQNAAKNPSLSSSSPMNSPAVDPVSNPYGYRPVLSHMHDALAEVESFVIQQHSQQMAQTLRERRADVSNEDIRVFVRKCVRRQVEAALYMPLRRTIFRIVYSFLANRSSELQRDMMILQNADPSFFTIDPYVSQAKGLGKAIKAFRDVIQAYLPADQCQLLMHAAAAVAELHTECIQHQREQAAAPYISLSSHPSIHADPIIIANNHNQTTDSRSSRSSVDSTSDQQQSSSQRDSSNNRKSFDGSLSPSIRQSMSFDIGKLFKRRTSMSNVIETLTNATLNPSTSNNNISPRISRDLNNMIPSASSNMVNSDSHLTYTNRTTLADPVGEMFTADETIPEQILRNERSIYRANSHDNSSVAESPPSTSLLSSPSSNVLESPHPVYRINDQKAWNALQQLLAPPENRPDSVRLIDNNDDSSNHDINVLVGITTSTVTSTNTSPYHSSTSLSTSMISNDHDTMKQEMKESLVDADGMIADEHEAGSRQISQAESNITAGYFENSMQIQQAVVSADDFLPLFTYVLVQAALPHLLLVKEIMTSLVDDEEVMGECGYYLTTLEASAQHISDLARLYEQQVADGGMDGSRPSINSVTESSIRRSSLQNVLENQPIIGYFDSNGHATVDSVESAPFGVNFSSK